MTILSWVAGFQVRTGWHFLSAAESARLSGAMRSPDGVRLRAIARHKLGGRLVCLDAAERDPGKARVLILRRDGANRARVEEEHVTLSEWLRALGLTSGNGASPSRDRL
jgi:hypothetical protein